MANNKSNSETVVDTHHLTARVPADLAERLALIAEASDRTISAELRRAIRFHVEAEEQAAA